MSMRAMDRTRHRWSWHVGDHAMLGVIGCIILCFYDLCAFDECTNDLFSFSDYDLNRQETAAYQGRVA